MNLVVCGINYRSSPLAVREKLVFDAAVLGERLQSLLRCTQAKEALILSTCNRTELYCSQANLDSIADWFEGCHSSFGQGGLRPFLYIYQDLGVLRHLLRVASGLDSMVLGEPQILSQIKNAFSFAQAAGTVGACFQRLFQYVFSVTKAVRTQTAITRYPISVALSSVNLAKRVFSHLTRLKVLLVGAGSTTELVARHLRGHGVKQLWIANRTLAHAERLARSFGGSAISLDNITEYLTDVDMLITASASPATLLNKPLVQEALENRNSDRPILIIDLAVPRNVTPDVGQLQEVYLYNLDDLQAIVQKNLGHRCVAAKQAEFIIESKVLAYKNRMANLQAVPLVVAYRKKAEELQVIEVEKALAQLKNGVDVECVLRSLAHHLTGKLIHTPSVQLRKLGAQKEFLLLAAQLLGLKSTN